MFEELSFQEFPQGSPEQWKKKIIEELKGKPFEDLIWRTKEGFDVQPFYTPEDLEKIKATIPTKQKSGWQIRQDFVVKDFKEANKQAMDALKTGAEAVGFDVSKEKLTKTNHQKLVAGINRAKQPVHFKGVKLKDIDVLVAGFSSKTTSSVEFTDFTAAQLPMLSKYISKYPTFQFITVRSHHDSAVKQLAEVVKKASAVLAACAHSKIPLKKALPSIRFSISLSSDYFMEIAKLRALRLLWTEEVTHYEKMKDIPAFIHVENILQKSAKGEEHYNILRATTTAMAAIIGGCDSLSLKSVSIPGKSKSFSKRIYRNIQLLLKHESYFDGMNDAGAGSYYIETLTNKLRERVRLEMKG